MNTIRRGYYLGSKGTVCYFHKVGVPPHLPPFFAADCPRCQEKLTAGKVTGLEPHPSAVGSAHARTQRKGWSLTTSVQGIAKREGVAAARAHRKIGVTA